MKQRYNGSGNRSKNMEFIYNMNKLHYAAIHNGYVLI